MKFKAKKKIKESFMEAVEFPESNFEVSDGEDLTIPAFYEKGKKGNIVTAYKMPWRDRLKFLFGEGIIYVLEESLNQPITIKRITPEKSDIFEFE